MAIQKIIDGLNVTAVVCGDPPPERSALNNHEVWVPQYDDEPVKPALPKTTVLSEEAYRVAAKALEIATDEHAKDKPINLPHSMRQRSRPAIYAAFALSQVFKTSSQAEISLSLRQTPHFFATAKSNRTSGTMKWFKEATLDRVVTRLKAEFS